MSVDRFQQITNCEREKESEIFLCSFRLASSSAPHPQPAGKQSQIPPKLSLEVKHSLDKHSAQEMLWTRDHFQNLICPVPRGLLSNLVQ